MARNCCCRCDAVDCTAAWCVTMYAWVRAASKRYDYSSMSRHGPQWRRKKNYRLWTWNFSFSFSLLHPDGMARIDHHHHRARRWLGPHEQGALRAQVLHMIPTVVIAVPCLCWSQMGWCVMMEARRGRGHLVMVWWPLLCELECSGISVMALCQPHCYCDSALRWMQPLLPPPPPSSDRHLESSIALTQHPSNASMTNRLSTMNDRSIIVVVQCQQQTCIVTAIKFYLPRPLIYYVEPFAFFCCSTTDGSFLFRGTTKVTLSRNFQ